VFEDMPGPIAEAVQAGDQKEICNLLSGLSEPQRRALARPALRYMREISAFDERASGLALVVLGTALPSELGRLPEYFPGLHAKAVVDVLRQRKAVDPSRWVDMLLAVRHWRVVRRLVREGMVPKPDHAAYTSLMVQYLAGGPYPYLKADSDLLQDEVWRIFEVEGGPQRSLATADSRYSRGRWGRALKQLSQEGLISRDRLLDATLSALGRDFSKYEAAWFSRFHQLMAPTLEESAARASEYAELLHSSTDTSLAVAMKELQRLCAAGQLDLSHLDGHTDSVLRGGPLGAARGLIRVLDQLARKGGPGQQIALAAAAGLGHQSVDIQEAALTLVLRTGDPGEPGLRAILMGLAPHTSSSVAVQLQPQLDVAVPVAAVAPQPGLEELRRQIAELPEKWAALAGLPDAVIALEAGQEPQAVTLDLARVPVLAGAEQIDQLDDLEQVIELAARVLEDASDPIEVELVMDGISRFSTARPSDFELRTGPLRKRLPQLARLRRPSVLRMSL
jgi:hypothetical protein